MAEIIWTLFGGNTITVEEMDSVKMTGINPFSEPLLASTTLWGRPSEGPPHTSSHLQVLCPASLSTPARPS